MTRPIVAHLALKDLYLTRWIVVSSIVAGILSLAIAPVSPTAFYVGSVSFICVLIVLNIYLVLGVVTQEKKDKVRLFVLSLPISTTDYVLAKVLGCLSAFALPWLLLTALSVLLIQLSPIPDGFIPFTLTVSTYVLGYHCLLLGVAMATEAQIWTGLVILLGNVGVNFLIPLLFRLPSGGTHISGEVAVWGLDIVSIIGLQLTVGAVGLALGVIGQTRKHDFA